MNSAVANAGIVWDCYYKHLGSEHTESPADATTALNPRFEKQCWLDQVSKDVVPGKFPGKWFICHLLQWFPGIFPLTQLVES